jgi:hypothetical protein
MAKTFGFKKPQSGPKDPGPKFKLLVRVSGLVVLGGLFLTFLLDQSLLTLSETLPADIEKDGFMDAIKGLFGGSTIPGALTKTLLMLGFVFPIFLGLSMLLRAKYRGGQMTFLILFNLGAFLMVHFFGGEAGPETNGIVGNFFAQTGVGYWVTCGGLFLPFIGMFFLDESI